MTESEGALNATATSVSLTVNDLPASVAWYRDLLGFAVEKEHERDGKAFAATMRSGTARLLLGRDDGARGADRPKGEGFSIMFTTDADADEIANRIRGLGGILDTEPFDTPWGARAFRVRDPDGFRLTISSTRTTTPAPGGAR